MKFLEILEETLKQDSRFVGEDGRILKTKVYDACMDMDGLLLERLINNETLKSHFFVEVNGTLVFDKMKFAWVLDSREFLPDSYTMFKNKIGLTDSNGNLISQQSDVTLVWPYKDCVLEGGQTKEDQKRDEIFYNETLAPDEVNRLLYPKVFSNAKRYSRDGVEEITEIEDTDNLIIKGNNLMVLASLLKRYEGTIKCIYIDPPYNTKNGSFKYNDTFSHSTWLTFMKNRLNLARQLLAPSGVIFIICDEIEEAYLKVMGNNIFGRGNYIGDLIWQKRKGGGNDSRFLALDHDYILCWVNDISFQNKKWRAPYDEKYLKRYREVAADGRRYYWDTVSRDGLQTPIPVAITCPDGSTLTINSQKSKETIESELKNGDMRLVKGSKGWTLHHRVYLSDAGKVQRSILLKSGTNKTAKDEIEALFGEANAFEHAKPEKLVLDLLTLVTQPGDIVLDFFLGSGTTAAVAHKMGRRYIGVEQMDYINTVTAPRLQKVIEGEQGGISKDVNWQGGGSFVYCELMEQNESIASALQAADTSEEVQAILNRVTDDGLIIPSVLPDDLRSHMDEFAQMPLEQQKKLVMELIDKNRLYVNLCDMDDAELAVSDADKAFTRCFYRMDERGGM